MMSEQKPKNCGYCRGDSIKVVESAGCMYVCCSDCGARGPIATTHSEAVRKWNGRFGVRAVRQPGDVVMVHRVKIHRDVPRAAVYQTTLSCGHTTTLLQNEMQFCPKCGSPIFYE